MRIDFPNTKNMPVSIPPEDATETHQYLQEMHLLYIKKQSEQNMLYIKLLGIFLLTCTVFYVLQINGIVTDFLIGTIFTGIGILVVMIANTLLINPPLDEKVDYCIRQGKDLEEKYPSLIGLNLFKRFDNIKSYSFKGVLLSRLAPFVFVMISTTAAGIALSLKASSVLAIGLSIFSVGLLIASSVFFYRIIKKNF